MKRKTLVTLSVTALKEEASKKGKKYNVYNFYLIKYSTDGEKYLFKVYAEVDGKKKDEKKDIKTLASAQKYYNKIRDKHLFKIK